jgi:amino acid adenylation domain-containing protein
MVCGCSSSLVAVCQACMSLLSYQSDMMLAGACSITFPQKRGTFYQEGGMTSPDGHCRAFDSEASGTVFGAGAGVVLLKRLEDAVRDGDQLYAVIRGFGMNNDGSSKVGYTAPSVEGQANVIALAHAAADVEPGTIGYIEAHGTGTPLGDPIELAALNQAFRSRTNAKKFCAVGTAKTNVGHLDVAAGVTGLIHASHVVRHGLLPPTLHYKNPNPKFDLENSPFYVNSRLAPWRSEHGPRRAGVSAFGVGGTNAHVIIEEAPTSSSSKTSRRFQVLTVSARSEAALVQAVENLGNHFKTQPQTSLADAAWTLQMGRHDFACRRAIVAGDTKAVVEFTEKDGKQIHALHALDDPGIYFLFPGQGAQHPNMAREIYETEPIFRQTIDQCAEILKPHLGEDLRNLLYPSHQVSEEARKRVTDTVIAQPAIFSVEYSLARLWMSWGIQPKGMIGHSIGEFAAGCIAGVFSLEDALAMVAARGRMMQNLPAGGMLSVRLAKTELQQRLNGRLSLAAVNSPSLCVVSGAFDALDEFEKKMANDGVACRRLVTSHAFHSAMMDPILEPFVELVRKVKLSAPKIPYISGVTGNWIKNEDATDPSYWGRHFRQPVEFSEGMSRLRKEPKSIFLEVGPGNVLSTLARQHQGSSSSQSVLTSLSDGFSGEGDSLSLMSALGNLWAAGARPDWRAVHGGEKRLRISLPTYPFERKRFFLEEPVQDQAIAANVAASVPETSAPASTERSVGMQTDFGLVREENVVMTADRASRIAGKIQGILEELSGIDLSSASPSTGFLEMGFDSLFLTQVTQSLHNDFGIKVTFRQLLGELSSIQALAEHLDRVLPTSFMAETPSTPAVPPTAPVPVPVAAVPTNVSAGQVPSAVPQATATGVAGESSIERLMREQLQAMNQLFSQQIQVLRGGVNQQPGVTAVPPISAPVTAPATMTPAASTPVSQASTPSPAAIAKSEKEEFKPFGPYKPPQRGASGGMTSRQEAALKRLIDQYTTRTAKSKNLTQQNRSPLADPRVVSGFRAQWKEMVYPITTDRSQGSRLWDVDGNEYIDILNGFGPIMLGHRPAFVEKAVERQLHEGFEIGPQTPMAGEVAKMFCEMTGNERMTYCNTGSEAVTAALRVARTVTGRNKVVLFAGAYHGMFDEVLVKGIKRGGVPQAAPVAPGIPREKVANVVVLDYGTPESLEYIRQNAKDLAAVLVEPVQSRHPNLQPVEFLKEIRKITQDAGTALIFDEVVTGFRVHPGGCQALFGIRADLATYGKVVAGGMPIGILAGKAAYMDALDGGAWQFGDDSYPEVGVTFFAGTFVRHPLAVAATRAVLRHFKEQGPALQESLSRRTEGLVGRINLCFERENVPSRIQHFGSIFYFSFPPEERFASLFYYYLRLKGVHVLEGFPCFLTTSHSEADVETIVRAFEETSAEMRKAGFFSTTEEEEVTGGEKATEEAPVTEPQLEVWLSDQLGEDASRSYNESFTLHMKGAVNLEAFKNALQQVVDRHDALRASFAQEGHIQKFAQSLVLNLPVVDLASLPAAERQSRLHEIVSEDAHTAFRLNEGPLVRAQLVRLEPLHHALIFTAHHIVCDGWSTNVLLTELSKTYNAVVHGKSSDLPLPMSFAAYSRSQARFLNSAEGESVEQFWLEQFKQPVAPLNLPTDRPRPATREFGGATYRRKINAETYLEIKKLGAKQKVTLFVTLLAGFQVLLSRLSGQDDIVVGIPTAGQSLVDDAILVGHCVNFIPLRGSLKGNPTASEFLSQMKQTLLAGYEHQNYTYGRLVRKLQLQRDPSRLPLTEVQFNLERVGEGLEFDGFTAEVDPNPKSFVNFDIFLNVVESKDGLTIDCDYNTGLFDEATIARWLNHYETLLLGMVADATKPVSRLPLLSKADQEQMRLWNSTRAEYPLQTVHELFESQAEATPEAIAVVFENQSLTYRELDGRANQLARYLEKSGAKRGSLIGLLVERSLDMIVGLLGILKSGAAYVPLDSTYPAERIAFVLKDANAPILITQEKLASNLPKTSSTVICIDSEWMDIAEQSITVPAVRSTINDLAYVIYTSGSTGIPKGVEIPHRAVTNLLSSMRKKPGLTTRDTLMAVTTISFDIAALELFLPLSVGAKLVIASREVAGDGTRLLDQLVSSGTTAMQATPVTWKLLLEAGWNGTPTIKALCGGEAFPRELANEMAKRASSLWNMYGPTETTIWSSTVEVKAGEGKVPVGPPIDNTQFYVLDGEGQVVPIGIVGELHIGGDGLARGYFHRSELTTEKFVSAEIDGMVGKRIYKTGDLVRRLANGTFEFFGRLDHQVKLRGFRIELGEIETALGRYPGVKEAVVVVREDVPGDKRLVAYVTSDQQALTIAPVREFLTGKLPNYMIPSAVVRLDAMPLTPNGKIDRKALPAPAGGRSSREKEFTAPRTEQEKIMADIWAEVLHLERVGIHDNLFELGADSLHIFQIVARVGKAGIKVAPATILKHRTIAAVFAQLEASNSGTAKSAPTIAAVSRDKYRVKTVLNVPQKDTVR